MGMVSRAGAGAEGGRELGLRQVAGRGAEVALEAEEGGEGEEEGDGGGAEEGTACRRLEVVERPILPRRSPATAASRPADDPRFAGRGGALTSTTNGTGKASGTLQQCRPADCDYSSRIGRMKVHFTRSCAAPVPSGTELSASRRKHRDGNVWQRRFWEHTIQEERELEALLDYKWWAVPTLHDSWPSQPSMLIFPLLTQH